MHKGKEEVLRKIREKADQLGLKFDRKIFVASFLTKKEVNILNYLAGSPAYDKKFGKPGQQRAKNFEKFLLSNDLIKIDSKGLAVQKRYILSYIKLLNDPKHKSMIEKLAKKIRPNSMGYSPIVKASKQKISEDSFDVMFHEWMHTLFNYNRLGFYNTGDNRWKYNEGMTVFAEYYLGNYYGRDVGFLKERIEWTKKHGAKTTFEKNLKYVDMFIKLIEAETKPSKRRTALFKFFKELPAPAAARQWPKAILPKKRLSQ